MSILEDITSRDAARIWAAAGAIRRLRERSELLSLAEHIDLIRRSTAGIDLGGMVRPNSTHLNFALRKLEFVRDSQECLCGLYTMDDMFDPDREARDGWVRIREVAQNQGGRIDYFICDCTVCGVRYRVDPGEYHYTWWAWKRV